MAKILKVDKAHHEDWLAQDETQKLIELIKSMQSESLDNLADGSAYESGNAIKTHENMTRDISFKDCLDEVIDVIMTYDTWE